MAVINPNIGDVPATTYNAAAVTDKTDDFAGRSGALGTGVIAGMGVTAAGTLTLTVAAGTVTVLGVIYTYAGGTVTITTNAGALDRRDVVIYQVGTGITKIDGTAASYTPTAALWSTSSTGNPPVKPAITESTDVVICEIYMPYNASTVGTTPGTGNGYVIDKSNVLVPQGATTRIVTGTVLPGEITVINSNATGNVQLTLPNITTLPQGTKQTIINNCGAFSVNVIVNPTGTAATISIGGVVGNIPSSALTIGWMVTLTLIGTVWTAVSASWSQLMFSTLPVSKGGTASSTAGGALTNLGAQAGPLTNDVTTVGAVSTVNAVKGVALTAAQATLVSQANNVVTRTATATLTAGEITVFTGATTGVVLTMPSSVADGTKNAIFNQGSVPITIFWDTTVYLFLEGYTNGATTFTLPANQSVTFVKYGSFWNLQSSTKEKAARVYVTEYGADPTGFFDSGVAINAAIAALGNKGGDVYLAPGNYKIATPIVMGNGTQVSALSPAITLTSTPLSTTTVTSIIQQGQTFAAVGTASGPGQLGFWTSSLVMVLVNYTSYSAGVFTGLVLASGAGPVSIPSGTLVTQGTQSSVNGVRLIGAGRPGPPLGGWIGQENPNTVLIAGTKDMKVITVQGPILGWGIENIFINGLYIAKDGVYVQSGAWGSAIDVSVTNCSRSGFWFTAVNGFPSGDYSGMAVSTSFRNHCSNLTVTMPTQASVTTYGGTAQTNSYGIMLTGDTNNGYNPSANTTYCTFDVTSVSVSDPGVSGYNQYAVYHQYCDNVAFKRLDTAQITGGGGTSYSVAYDYLAPSVNGGNTPFDCLIDDCNLAGATGTVTTVTANAYSATRNYNAIEHRRGALPFSSTGNTLIAGTATTNNYPAVPYVYPTMIYIEQTSTTGTVAVVIGQPSGTGTMQNQIQIISSDVLAKFAFSFRLPAGWTFFVSGTITVGLWSAMAI